MRRRADHAGDVDLRHTRPGPHRYRGVPIREKGVDADDLAGPAVVELHSTPIGHQLMHAPEIRHDEKNIRRAAPQCQICSNVFGRQRGPDSAGTGADIRA